MRDVKIRKFNPQHNKQMNLRFQTAQLILESQNSSISRKVDETSKVRDSTQDYNPTQIESTDNESENLLSFRFNPRKRSSTEKDPIMSKRLSLD